MTNTPIDKLREALDDLYLEDAERARINAALDELESELESELTARIPPREAIHAAITEAHERWTSLFFMSRDSSSHWYIVPAAKRAEWDAWCDMDEDDERAWVVPEYAERLNGSPELVEFRRAELTVRTAETEEQAAVRSALINLVAACESIGMVRLAVPVQTALMEARVALAKAKGGEGG
jgi:hypothetical protein